MSRSLAPHVKSPVSRLTIRGGRIVTSCSVFYRAQHARDGSGEPQPSFELGLRGATPFARQRVELGPAVVLGRPPFGLDQSLFFHPIEGGVERSFFDPQRIVGKLVNTHRDPVPVVRPRTEDFQNEQVERSLKQ